MTILEEIEQSSKLIDALCEQRKDEIKKLKSDINKAGKRYGITTDNPMDSMASARDSDGIRPNQVGAEAVHEGGSRNPNREFAEER